MAKCNMELKFREFRAENPKVERVLFKIAMELKKKGYESYGLPALWEVLRYNFAIDVPGGTYKFPNGLKAYYARFLMLKYPKLRGFFRVRDMFVNGEPDLSDLLETE